MQNGNSFRPPRKKRGRAKATDRISAPSAVLSIKDRARFFCTGALMVMISLYAFKAVPAQAAERVYDPFSYIDGSTITLTGRVAAVNGPEFTLDYGSGSITVELDETPGIPYEAEDILVPGETVTVSGIIDDDIFERRTIEAGGVYIHEREVHYLSNMLDDPNAKLYIPPQTRLQKPRLQKQSAPVIRTVPPQARPIATKPTTVTDRDVVRVPLPVEDYYK